MLSIIAAMAKNRVIGKRGEIPWHISADLKRTKRITMGHPVIMGRKTFESIVEFRRKKPNIFKKEYLPGRTNIVLTRDKDFSHPGAVVVSDVADALIEADKSPGSEEVFVIGGGQVYSMFLKDADKLYLTEVDAEIDGDVFFPEVNFDEWKRISSEPHTTEIDGEEVEYRFNEYVRELAV